MSKSKKKRVKLLGKKYPNIIAVKGKAKEFRFKDSKQFSVLFDETDNLEETNDHLTEVIT